MTYGKLVSEIVMKILCRRMYRSEDNKGSKKIHDVREVLAIKGFSQCPLLVRPCKEKMK